MTRYSRANNTYLDEYDKVKASQYIIYLDMNNLYGLSMVSNLSVCGFRWADENEIESFNIDGIADQLSIVYILEVDLHYPSHQRESHNDYPLGPEKFFVTKDLLSLFCKTMTQKLDVSTRATTKKLVPNLYNKQHYIVHYRNLKQ